MKTRRVAWEEGRWTTPPASARRLGEHLVVAAEQGSDFWEKTLYGFERSSGHALLAAWGPDAAVEVSFDLRGFDELYDQAGLMLWLSRTRWIKVGVEINDGVPHVGAVVTDEFSDWSLAPVPEWKGSIVTIRASSSKDAVILRATATGHAWRTLRVAHFEPGSAAQAGPFLCAPQRAGFEARFLCWKHTEPDPELHWSPPLPELD